MRARLVPIWDTSHLVHDRPGGVRVRVVVVLCSTHPSAVFCVCMRSAQAPPTYHLPADPSAITRHWRRLRSPILSNSRRRLTQAFARRRKRPRLPLDHTQLYEGPYQSFLSLFIGLLIHVPVYCVLQRRAVSASLSVAISSARTCAFCPAHRLVRTPWVYYRRYLRRHTSSFWITCSGCFR